jgi:hypothetical protein
MIYLIIHDRELTTTPLRYQWPDDFTEFVTYLRTNIHGAQKCCSVVKVNNQGIYNAIGAPLSVPYLANELNKARHPYTYQFILTNCLMINCLTF